jgi:hypothetical protein
MFCKSRAPSLVMAVILACAGTSALGQGKQAAPATVRASTGETNSNGTLESRGLKDFEQSIFKPFRSLEPEGSLDPVMQQPQGPPPVQNKRVKEAVERRKDWAFMTPEEILNVKNDENALNSSASAKDGDTKQELSPMDRYFQRLYGVERKPEKSKPQKKESFGHDALDSSSRDFDDGDDSSTGLPESVRETQRNLKKSREARKDLEARNSSSGLFTDVFALERKKPTLEEERVERERMEAYRKSLGLDPTPTFGTTFSPMSADPKDPYRIALPPALMSSAPSSSVAPAPAAHVAAPKNPFMDSGPKDATAPTSLTPTLPKVEPAKSYLPPQPTFLAPRRSF